MKSKKKHLTINKYRISFSSGEFCHDLPFKIAYKQVSVRKAEIKFTIEFAVSKQIFLACCECLNISHKVGVPKENGISS